MISPIFANQGPKIGMITAMRTYVAEKMYFMNAPLNGKLISHDDVGTSNFVLFFPAFKHTWSKHKSLFPQFFQGDIGKFFSQVLISSPNCFGHYVTI